MTYRQFHLVFNLPITAAAMLLMWPVISHVWLVLLLLCIVVVVATFPWDNWAVSKKIWEFPEDRVWFRVRKLPIEEVAFFVIETLEVAGCTIAFLGIIPPNHSLSDNASPVAITSTTMIGVLIVGVLTAVLYKPLARLRANRPSSTYAVHLLYWISPLLIVQWVIGAEVLALHVVPMLLATTLIGTYLTAVDVYAVRRGIWFFDEKQVGSVRLFGVLPWEEAAFFYLTSLLVAQSTVLLVPAAVR